MDEDVIAIIGFFTTIIVVAIGVPLVRALVRRWDRQGVHQPVEHDTSARLERIEHAIEAMAIEVERIAEGQRFVTRLMADKAQDRVAIPMRGDDRNS